MNSDLFIKISGRDEFCSLVEQARRVLVGKKVVGVDISRQTIQVADAKFQDVCPFLALAGINAEYLSF